MDNWTFHSFWGIVSTALAVLFTLVYSVVYIVPSTYPGYSFDCSKLLNRVEPITQTRPEEKRKREKGEKEKKEKKEEKGEKGQKVEKEEKGENGE